MLELLTDQERSVNDLVKQFNITVGAISQHLKVLLDNELVVRRKEGRFRFYRSRPERLQEVHEWTKRYEQFWESRLDRLGDYLDRNS